MDKSSMFKQRYDALDRRRKRRLLELFNEWGIGNATTAYIKISGNNLKKIEIVAIDGMLTMLEQENSIAHEGEQLTINFDWSAADQSLTYTIQSTTK